jgi:hypothetical protein
MKTTQGWGWLAAGVLALGLNGIYHDGGAEWAHRAVNRVFNRIEARTAPILALAGVHADPFLAETEMTVARDETASCRAATAIARVQTRIARTHGRFAQFEAMSARQEAALARVEASRAKIGAQVARVRLAPVAFTTMEIPEVACPRVRVNVPRVNVPKVPLVKIPAPVVVVEMKGAGPV